MERKPTVSGKKIAVFAMTWILASSIITFAYSHYLLNLADRSILSFFITGYAAIGFWASGSEIPLIFTFSRYAAYSFPQIVWFLANGLPWAIIGSLLISDVAKIKKFGLSLLILYLLYPLALMGWFFWMANTMGETF